MLKREEISPKLMENYSLRRPKDLKDLFEKSQENFLRNVDKIEFINSVLRLNYFVGKTDEKNIRSILFDVRLPRIFMAILIGMLLASVLSPVILMILKKLFKIFMGNSYYYLEELPLYISVRELSMIYIVAFAVVFISTIYPAAKAARMKPVEALKYE